MARNLVIQCIRAGCLIGLSLALASCGFFSEQAQRPAWRNAAERACIKQKSVLVSQHITPRSSIDGPGICGLNNPYYVTALANGTVRIKSRATLGCPMIATLDQWLKDVVQPAAMARFGEPVTEISTMGSYACRRRNHRPGAKLSEHGFGNALDIGAFTVGQDRKLKVIKHWRRGDTQERAFLRESHAGACRYFRTVLGPGADRHHENHFHLDLAMHGKNSRGLRHYCRPVIKDIAPRPRKDDLPDPPYLEPDPEIARRMNTNKYGSRRLAQGPRPLMQSQRLQSMPIGNLPRGRLRSIPLPRADIPQVATRSYGSQTYGRLRTLQPGAPLQSGRILSPPSMAGTLRADGVYVPPGYR